ncbi:universal stress protein [Salsipaludibacter albus]|uniref:universal stress protein n=1 Tax=Salsipaludibacter albus TaxID=2849650 RepID=UPI001EE4D8D2
MDAIIAVGVDGSDHSIRALEHAVDEARLRGGRVVAVHAWRPTTWFGQVDHAGAIVPYEELEARAGQVLAEALEAVGDDVEVEATTYEGPPAEVLVELSQEVDMVVVGTRGRGGFTGLLLGSTSRHLTTHAACPVLVVPAGADGGSATDGA